MSSNLKVNTILPSTGTTIGIGTVGGLINVVGNIDVNSTSGISTFNGLEISGIVTAKAGAAVTYYGDGSNLTGITQTTINNNADNRLITGSGTANTLEAEANITFDGTNLDLGDGKKIRFGNSNDFQVYHDGTYNVIKGSSNVLFFENSGNINFTKVGLSETYLKMIPDGAVELYYDNSKKFETSSSGATLTGDLYATSRLLVNTTSAGESNGDEATFANTGGNAGITIRSAVNAETKIYFSEGTSGGSQYRGTINYNHNTNYMAFSANETEKMRIKSDGNVSIADGNLIVASGHGIDFSATADAGGSLQTTSSELFDDYEEGSWTPVIAASAANPSFTFASGFPRGRYRKIGEQVTLWYDIAWTGLPSQGGGTLQIQNFPYATANNMYHGGGLMSHTVGTNAGGAYTGKHTHYANANSSFMYILSGASTNGHMQCTALNSSGHIFGFFTFIS